MNREDYNFYNQKQKYFMYNLKRILWSHIIGIIISVVYIYSFYTNNDKQFYPIISLVTVLFNGITLLPVLIKKFKEYIIYRQYLNEFDMVNQYYSDKFACVLYSIALVAFIYLLCANPFLSQAYITIGLWGYIKFMLAITISLSSLFVFFPLAFRDYSGDVIADYKEQWEAEKEIEK